MPEAKRSHPSWRPFNDQQRDAEYLHDDDLGLMSHYKIPPNEKRKPPCVRRRPPRPGRVGLIDC